MSHPGASAEALAFVSASGLGIAGLTDLYNATYANYYLPFHLTSEALGTMCDWFDNDLDASVVAMDGARPVAMAVLARRGDRGWIGGMGVLPEYRGRGLGDRIMRAVLDNARALALRTVDLEVLEQNAPARRIYEAVGFVAVRGLSVWVREPSALAAGGGDVRTETLDPWEALDAIESWRSTSAPWQRNRETLAHVRDSLQAAAIERDGRRVAALVYRAGPTQISVGDVGAARGHEAAVEGLLRSVIAAHPDVPLRLLNLPDGDPANAALERIGAHVHARQTEMRASL